jgi:hypothetical protein
MAEVKNAFIKSKMNKDLDDRLLPSGEYRNAINAQVSKSEGSDVGALENVLGNSLMADFTPIVATATVIYQPFAKGVEVEIVSGSILPGYKVITNDYIDNITVVSASNNPPRTFVTLSSAFYFDVEEVISFAPNLSSIGYLSDEFSGKIYVFLTDFIEGEINNPSYNPNANNFIFEYDTNYNKTKLLVKGAFLNFSKTNPIFGVNLLEEFLFWTDNRNQPRRINVNLANSNNVADPTYYTSEDQISVAKYNPYQAMQLYSVSKETGTISDEYETTAKDVVSMYFPNGGVGDVVSFTSDTVTLSSFVGDIITPSSNYDSGSTLAYTNSEGFLIKIEGATVSSAVYTEATSSWLITIVGATFPSLNTTQKIVLNPNPYYNPLFSGDEDFLKDKFVRFGYRFKFNDGEYSLFSTFTQAAFIPNKDGYFMYVQKENISSVDDESDAYKSTIVSFFENKVNSIDLKIPLPYANYDIENLLKVSSIDLLYKESDSNTVKVIESVQADRIKNSSGIATVTDSAVDLLDINISNLKGGVVIGEYVTGDNIVGNPTVISFTYASGSTTSGIVTLSVAQTITSGTEITIGNPSFFTYKYESIKPIKALSNSETTRVYDKVPVRALAQEVISNRVVYANYQDKHTSPTGIDYNVLISEKSEFDLGNGSAEVANIEAVDSVTITGLTGKMAIGSKAISPNIPNGTIVINIDNFVVTFSNNTTLSVGDIIKFEAASNIEAKTSTVSYPSSSLKTNRTYQVGLVLSDRYGRQSSVILSNSTRSFSVDGQSYSGSTLFSDYIKENITSDDWRGNSIKLLFNSIIGTSKNFNLGEPGIYNGDASSSDYNPLGWYSFKVVVKQTQQEYYNVYVPGIMASYPKNIGLDTNSISHMVLIGDNINKVPRDLSEVGPDQKLYRSSVEIFGRVENSSESITTNVGEGNKQYFPSRGSDIVNSIAVVDSLFDYDPLLPPEPNFFPQFYSLESNPLVARISTRSKIGQLATTNYLTSSFRVSLEGTTDLIRLVNATGDISSISVGDVVKGPGFPSDLKVDLGGFTAGSAGPVTTVSADQTSDIIPITNGNGVLAGQSIVGLGIPDGSFILEVLSSPWRVRLNNIASVNSGTTVTMTNPATLDVTSSVSVNFGDKVSITPVLVTGIQTLSVYETKPVKSFLDIFWETSTTGLINDVNNAILNSSTESGSGPGAAGINSYNTSPFTEALWPSGLIPVIYPSILLNSIYLVDSFGQAINPSNIDVPLSITSVTNGFLDNVSSYFNLVETSPGSYEYNIIITNDYAANVYYGSESNLRIFKFNFLTIVSGIPTSFSETISLINEPPFILGPGEINKQTTPILIENKRVTDEVIVDLGGSNGSGGVNPPLFPYPPSNAGLELVFSKVANSEVNSNGNTTSYFSVDSLTGVITNNGSNDPSMPADRYTLTVSISDPATYAQRNVIINMGLIVRNIEQRTITGTLFGTNTPYTATFLMLDVPLQPGQIFDPRNGYYAYTLGSQTTEGPWATLLTNTGSGPIQIVPGNAGYQCFPWKYTLSDRVGLESSLYASQCIPTLNNGYTWSDGPILNPDPINYTFEFSE